MSRKAYEIGKSTIPVNVGCQPSEKAARAALEEALGEVKDLLDAEFKALGITEQTEEQGYKLPKTDEIDPRPYSPIQTSYYDKDEDQYFWKNLCSGETSESPIRADYVYGAGATVSIWLPNQGTILAKLATIVEKLESMSNEDATGPTIAARKWQGQPYKRDVTESTEKAAWEKVKTEAQSSAQHKRDEDFVAKGYDDKWFVDHSFQEQNSDSFYARAESLPAPAVEQQDDGTWIAKFSKQVNYPVYFQQANVGGNVIADNKSYDIVASAETKKGLFGELQVTISQNCTDSDVAAKTAVKAVADKIFNDKFRPLNAGKASESDRIEYNEPDAYERSPWSRYTQKKGDDAVSFYYNTCTLKTHKKTTRPTDQVWVGEQQIVIRSADLTALKALREDLIETYKRTSADPTKLRVSVSSLQGKVKFAERDRIGIELDKSADEEFFCETSEYYKDAALKGFVYACLADPTSSPGFRSMESGSRVRSAFFGAEMAPEQEEEEEEEEYSPPSAAERGVKGYYGVHRIKYVVRKELKLPTDK